MDSIDGVASHITNQFRIADVMATFHRRLIERFKTILNTLSLLALIVHSV